MSKVREIFYFGNRIITNVERSKLCLTNRSDVSSGRAIVNGGYKRYAQDSPTAQYHCD